jgi:methylphosphotriester-DNA--protein-cysteine methyltransferase
VQTRADVFERVIRVLEEKPTALASEIARQLHVHRHTVANVVRACTGLNFRAFREQHLFERARALLCERPDLTLREIRILAGFHSARAFDSFVQRHAGRPPAELRRVSAGPDVVESAPLASEAAAAL